MQDYQYAARISPPDARPTICLLMDVANIPEDAILPLVQELRRRGQVAAMFAFADWHRRDMHLRHRLLDALGFMCIHGGSWENGSGGLKSMVDSIMKRAIKWMPQWFTNCDTYVLATGDRDFAHDASDLRWRGFRVWIASGETSINNELRLGADEFISLDRLPGRTHPASLLGVPANYYETTFGQRGRYARNVPSANAETSVTPPPQPRPAPPPRRTAPVPVTSPVAPPTPRPAATSTPAPAPAPTPVVTTTPATTPAPAASDEERELLQQLRALSGERGFVPQREALRALAPSEDPGGRIRSRLSNQIRDLIERGLLVRTHTMIGGNLTQVLTFPGVTIQPTAEPAPESTEAEPGPSERRGRGRMTRRPRPVETAEAEVEAVAKPTTTEPEAGTATTPVVRVGDGRREPAAQVPPVEPEIAAVQPPSTVEAAAPARPAARRPEREQPAVSRSAETRTAETVVGTGGPRVSWRDAVAAALAQARSEAGQPAAAAPARVEAPGVPATGPTATEPGAVPGAPSEQVSNQAAPAPAPTEQAVPGAPAEAAPVELSAEAETPIAGPSPEALGTVVEVPPTQPETEEVEEVEAPAPATRGRRRRPSTRRSARPETPSPSAESGEVQPAEAAGASPAETAAPEPTVTPRRRPARRRPASSATTGEGNGEANPPENPAAS